MSSGGGGATPPPEEDRILGAFAGLAIGDAAGWPAARHRSLRLAPWSRRLHRELDAFAEERQVTTLPVPFALNQPVEPLALGPSDDAEWLAWTASTIHENRAEAFGRLAQREDLRARISVWSALDNLAAGLGPPASGHDNPHFFDDAAAVRAVAFGAAGMDPVADAEVTNSGDGVLGAVAVATAVGALVRGAPMREAVDVAVAALPEDTAIGHAARTAVAVAREHGDPFSAVPALDAALLDHVYSYGVTAAETVPIALALADAAMSAAGSPGSIGSAASGAAFGAAVSAAACLASVADSAPALTGALAGAYAGYEALPRAWREAARPLAGCCLPELAGTDLLDVARTLASGGPKRSGPAQDATAQDATRQGDGAQSGLRQNGSTQRGTA
ncbi:ADP-ribosylglycohydrolase family protein [Microtetraspora fusca]|uniref:ADP-ribosylglycohydrolase family protein n=1 Tax=Microtetraspora fusca TaxID=1997 RepID=A0ABW6VGS9_MICFU